MKPLRVVLLGDGAWAARSLDTLLDAGHQVAAVVLRAAPSDTSLADVARQRGVTLAQPADINAADAVRWLRSLAPDLLLSVAYNQILGGEVRNVPLLAPLNFHAGMLPRYRGRNVLNWALINGETEVGITAHLIDAGIDTGDIILQRRLEVGWTETYGDLLARVVDAMPALVLDSVALMQAGAPPRRPQAHLAGTYCPGRRDGDEWLDWSDSSVMLHNKVRAISRPGPGARSAIDQEPVTIWRAYCDPAWPAYRATPGVVVQRRDDGVLVKTGDSVLLILEASVDGQAPGVPRWSAGTRLAQDQVTARLNRLEARAHDLEPGGIS